MCKIWRLAHDVSELLRREGVGFVEIGLGQNLELKNKKDDWFNTMFI